MKKIEGSITPVKIRKIFYNLVSFWVDTQIPTKKIGERMGVSDPEKNGPGAVSRWMRLARKLKLSEIPGTLEKEMASRREHLEQVKVWKNFLENGNIIPPAILIALNAYNKKDGTITTRCSLFSKSCNFYIYPGAQFFPGKARIKIVEARDQGFILEIEQGQNKARRFVERKIKKQGIGFSSRPIPSGYDYQDMENSQVWEKYFKDPFLNKAAPLVPLKGCFSILGSGRAVMPFQKNSLYAPKKYYKKSGRIWWVAAGEDWKLYKLEGKDEEGWENSGLYFIEKNGEKDNVIKLDEQIGTRIKIIHWEKIMQVLQQLQLNEGRDHHGQEAEIFHGTGERLPGYSALKSIHALNCLYAIKLIKKIMTIIKHIDERSRNRENKEEYVRKMLQILMRQEYAEQSI